MLLCINDLVSDIRCGKSNRFGDAVVHPDKTIGDSFARLHHFILVLPKLFIPDFLQLFCGLSGAFQCSLYTLLAIDFLSLGAGRRVRTLNICRLLFCAQEVSCFVKCLDLSDRLKRAVFDTVERFCNHLARGDHFVLHLAGGFVPDFLDLLGGLGSTIQGSFHAFHAGYLFRVCVRTGKSLIDVFNGRLAALLHAVQQGDDLLVVFLDAVHHLGPCPGDGLGGFLRRAFELLGRSVVDVVGVIGGFCHLLDGPDDVAGALQQLGVGFGHTFGELFLVSSGLFGRAAGTCIRWSNNWRFV